MLCGATILFFADKTTRWILWFYLLVATYIIKEMYYCYNVRTEKLLLGWQLVFFMYWMITEQSFLLMQLFCLMILLFFQQLGCNHDVLHLFRRFYVFIDIRSFGEIFCLNLCYILSLTWFIFWHWSIYKYVILFFFPLTHHYLKSFLMTFVLFLL